MVQFASYLRRVLCKTRLIFPRINGAIVPFLETIITIIVLSNAHAQHRMSLCQKLQGFLHYRFLGSQNQSISKNQKTILIMKAS